MGIERVEDADARDLEIVEGRAGRRSTSKPLITQACRPRHMTRPTGSLGGPDSLGGDIQGALERRDRDELVRSDAELVERGRPAARIRTAERAEARVAGHLPEPLLIGSGGSGVVRGHVERHLQARADAQLEVVLGHEVALAEEVHREGLALGLARPRVRSVSVSVLGSAVALGSRLAGRSAVVRRCRLPGRGRRCARGRCRLPGPCHRRRRRPTWASRPRRPACSRAATMAAKRSSARGRRRDGKAGMTMTVAKYAANSGFGRAEALAAEAWPRRSRPSLEPGP